MEDRCSITNESRNKQGIQNISTEHDEAHNADKQIFKVFVAGFVAVSITTNVEFKVAKDEEKVRETLRERERSSNFRYGARYFFCCVLEEMLWKKLTANRKHIKIDISLS